jgi:hypothetical protein
LVNTVRFFTLAWTPLGPYFLGQTATTRASLLANLAPTVVRITAKGRRP